MSTTLAPGEVTVRDVPADRRNTVTDVDAALWDLAERLTSTLADDRPPPSPRVAPAPVQSAPPPLATPRTATLNAAPPRRTFADAVPPNAARGLPTINRLRTPGPVVAPAVQQIPRVVPNGAPKPQAASNVAPTVNRTLEPSASPPKPQPAPAKSGRATFSILANRRAPATESPPALPRVTVEQPAPAIAETPATTARPVERRLESRQTWKRAEPRLKLPATAWIGIALAGAAAVLAFFVAPAWI